MRTFCVKILLLLALTSCGSGATPASPTAVIPSPQPSTPTPQIVATAAALPTITALPQVISASTATPAVNANANTGPEFSPQVRSVWNTVNGSNATSGTCTGGSILPVYGLVEITPQGNDTLIWKNQEPQPYTFKKLGTNQYQFKGPSGLGLGEQTMTVTFTGQKALKMVHLLVPSKDPGCTHTFNYTGEYRWDRP